MFDDLTDTQLQARQYELEAAHQKLIAEKKEVGRELNRRRTAAHAKAQWERMSEPEREAIIVHAKTAVIGGNGKQTHVE